MKRLIEYAATIGVTYELSDDLSPHHPGSYSDSRRHIKILDGMTDTKTVCAFAHELGHATLAHRNSLFDWINDRQERAADEWAAAFLIDLDEYGLAESKYGLRTDWIAQELGVLERLVTAFERSLHRFGDCVYINPRMGAGQYAARIPIAV
ncbi:ImmA/IrrE family metallo-endopeptidase [Leucobacter salsicius]|uniref:ImmA/IrrE family metallo-endopeptidase n=1 Tax=Leucobacter salsicius TaxID=664638 RepID=UPI000371A0C0|nr:ImmA/IrrE family metallo-endopeptidase [Leucobacter salsicius]